MPHRATGARPPIRNIGLSLARAWANAVAELVTPGPAVTAATPHSRVTLDQPSAANAADCSWRTSMIRMPCSVAPVRIGQMCPPFKVNRWLTPARFRARATSSPALPESANYSAIAQGIAGVLNAACGEPSRGITITPPVACMALPR